MISSGFSSSLLIILLAGGLTDAEPVLPGCCIKDNSALGVLEDVPLIDHLAEELTGRLPLSSLMLQHANTST